MIHDALTPAVTSPFVAEPAAAPQTARQPVRDADTLQQPRPAASTRMPTVTPQSTLLSIARDPRLQRVFGEFLNNVFLRLDTDKLTGLLEEVAQAHPDNYEAFYKALQSRLKETKKGKIGDLRLQLKSLGVLKETLAGQTVALTAQDAKVDGYAEIGYNGRLIRPLKSRGMSITGPVAAVGYSESVQDYIESGVPRPYNKFVTLGDYEPLDREVGGLDAESLDMVVCPIGLHHAPDDKLDAFVDSIARVIRPGGSFILRDHDVTTPARAMMAHAAHSIFNAATGVTFEDENAEIRHFRSAAQWARLLNDKGFNLIGEAQLTEGDPSQNALMRFVKRPAPTADAAQTRDAFERQMRMSHADYQRPACQTYLTTLEWHLVHTAREQADFAQTTPPHRYPYLKHVGTLWKNFIASVREGIAAGGAKSLPVEYVLMNLFMVFCTTGEHLWRRALLAPLYLLPEGATQNSAGARQLAATQSAYAEFIKSTPFFNFPFMQRLGQQWKAVGQGGFLRAPVNLWLALVATLEYGAKAAVSTPLAAFYADGDFNHIHMMLDDPEGAAAPHLQGDEIKATDKQFSVVKTKRYLPFTKKVQDLVESGVNIASIGGRTKVQLKVRAPKSAGDLFAGVAGCRLLGTIPMHTGPADGYLRVEADVASLREVFGRIRDVPGAELTYVHDF